MIVTPIAGLCNCSTYTFCRALLSVHSSFAIISMGKRELVALLCLSSWCLLIVVRLFLKMQRVCLQFLIAVFPDHNHYFYNDTMDSFRIEVKKVSNFISVTPTRLTHHYIILLCVV